MLLPMFSRSILPSIRAHLRRFLGCCLLLGCLIPARSNPIISEFLARNISTVADTKGAYVDWIEIYNPGPESVDLGGWYLTDSATNLTQWAFPAQLLPAQGYLLVFASGKNAATAGAGLHTNFKLAASGGYLALVRPDGTTVASEFRNYPPPFGDVSFGPSPAGSPTPGVYHLPPTPRAANGPGWPGVASPVDLSRSGGLFQTPFTLTLTTAEPGAEIRYTLDGTVPTTASPRYTTPLNIDRTLRVRARAFAPNRAPGPVAGAAYTLVGPTALNRSSNLPIVVLDTYGPGIQADVRTVGYATILEPLNGRTTLPGAVNISSRATFEVRGSSSAGFPKRSYGMEIRQEDDSDRAHSVLGLPAESDWVLYAPYTDKTLIRDVLAYELSNRMGRYAPRTRFVELYVNRAGALDATDYQGVYVLVEKIKGGPGRVDLTELESTDYTQPNLSGGFILKKDRVDPNDSPFTTTRGHQLGIEWPRARELGTVQLNAIRGFMNQFETALYGSQFRNSVTGYQAYIDTDSFIDHWWLVETAKNIDGFRLSTFMFKDRGGKLNLGPIWDYNLSFGNADYLEGWKTDGWYWPQLGGTDYPWFARLFQDPEFTQRHTDRWVSYRTNALATANVLALIDSMTNQLAEAQVRNFQRWPSFGIYIWPNWFIGNSYAEEIDFLKRWVAGRLAWIDSTMIRWPEISPGPGFFPEGVNVTLRSSFPIYYTVDGTDPRAPGGGLSSSARNYFSPLALNETTRVIARARSGTRWSPPVTATFVVTIPPLRISELMYNPPTAAGPHPEDDYEFFEIRNVGEDPVSLAGVAVSEGIRFTFPTNAGSLLPHENVVVARNPEVFRNLYGPGVRLAGPFDGRLANSGERLVVTGALGEPIEDFTYDDGWAPSTDGRGFSLTRVFPEGTWKASSVHLGTPGRDDVPASDFGALSMELRSTPSAGSFVIRLPAAAGQSYSLQSASSVSAGDWKTLQDIPPQPRSGIVEIPLPPEEATSRVYRIVTPRLE